MTKPCECKWGGSEWCHSPSKACERAGEGWRTWSDGRDPQEYLVLCATCAHAPFMRDEIEPACGTCRGEGTLTFEGPVTALPCPTCDGTGEREI